MPTVAIALLVAGTVVTLVGLAVVLVVVVDRVRVIADRLVELRDAVLPEAERLQAAAAAARDHADELRATSLRPADPDQAGPALDRVDEGVADGEEHTAAGGTPPRGAS